MDQFLKKAKQLLPEKKQMRALLATLLLTIGIYLSFPFRGLLACFPFAFLGAILAGLVFPYLWFSLAAFPIAYFYALMAAFPSPLAYGVFALLSAFFGFLFVKGIQKKGKKGLLLLILSLVVGLLSPLVFAGSPFSYRKEEKDMKAYLEKIYPDQKFEKTVFFYDFTDRSYHALLTYENGESLLESSIVFGEEIQDGYYEDYAEFVLIKAKSDLIDAFYAADLSCRVDEIGLKVGEDEPIPGCYGTLSDEAVAVTSFSVTFRDEKPDRESFAEACKAAFLALEKNGVSYGSVTFHGLSRGVEVFTLTVTPETDVDEIPNFIQ